MSRLFIHNSLGSGPGIERDEPTRSSDVFTRHWKVKVDGLDPARSGHLQRGSLLNNLIGTLKQRLRHGYAERFSGLKIYDQFDICGLLYGQVGWLLSV
jgi:hypothetical protein